LECYVPNEDRYHPFNPNAWGVPGKTPPEELLEAGQHTYDNCQLACPCSAEPQTFPKCSDGVGLDSVQRCWYLSELGSSCDNTCASRGKYYSYAEPAQDMVPNLLGRAPAGKDNPWIFVECYVPSEDRYHPANNDAWGVPGKTPASEISEAKRVVCRVLALLTCPPRRKSSQQLQLRPRQHCQNAPMEKDSHLRSGAGICLILVPIVMILVQRRVDPIRLRCQHKT